jgi:hypothetical protein
MITPRGPGLLPQRLTLMYASQATSVVWPLKPLSEAINPLLL